jgi:hypothetical protein
MTPAPDSHSRNAEASDSLVPKTDRREREQAVLTPPRHDTSDAVSCTGTHQFARALREHLAKLRDVLSNKN